MAGKIADALDAKLSGAEEKALAVKPTNNVAAYDAYLHGDRSRQRALTSRENSELPPTTRERCNSIPPSRSPGRVWRLCEAFSTSIQSIARLILPP